MAKHCVKYGRAHGKRVCRKFAGLGGLGGVGKTSKGRCLRRSKNGKKCLKRAK